jgi:hypothetical protein
MTNEQAETFAIQLIEAWQDKHPYKKLTARQYHSIKLSLRNALPRVTNAQTFEDVAHDIDITDIVNDTLRSPEFTPREDDNESAMLRSSRDRA